MRKSIGAIFFSFLFLVLTGKVYAASITHIESPSSTTFTPQDEISFKIKLSINTSNDAIYYLRGVFYKKDTNNYCGYTWNNNAFFSGPYSTNEGWKKFLKVTIQDNKWEGEVRAKIDGGDSGCKDSGEYGFKLQRFTESGSANFDEQEEKMLTFTIPTPTPTPSPTPTPTPSPKPTKTPTPIKSGPTPTPTKKADPTPTKSSTTLIPTKNSPSPTSQVSSKNKSAAQSTITPVSQVLGANETIVETPTPINIQKENAGRSPVGKFVTIFGGILLTSSCGILMYKKYRKEKENEI